MENPTVQLPHTHNTEKRMFPATDSSSNSTFGEPDLMEISPPAGWKSKRDKQKSIVDCELLVLDSEDPNDAVTIDEKVAPDAKGKKPVHNCFSGDKLPPKDSSPLTSVNDCIQGFSSSHISFIDDDFDFNGMDLAVDHYDKECALLQAHFDSVDIPPGVEAIVPWWNFSAGNEEQSVTASGSTISSKQSNSIVETSRMKRLQTVEKLRSKSVQKSASKKVSHGSTPQTSGAMEKLRSTSVQKSASKKVLHGSNPQTSGAMDLAVKNYDRESAFLQILSDSVDIPSGVEAAVHRGPFFAGNEEQSVTATSTTVFSKQSNSVGTSEANTFQSMNEAKAISLLKSASKKFNRISKLPYPGHGANPNSYVLPNGLLQPETPLSIPDQGSGVVFDFFSNGIKNISGSPNFSYASHADPSASHFVSYGTVSNMFNIHYMQDHHKESPDNISSQISPPISDEQGDGSENSIVKKMERFKKFDTLDDPTGHLFCNTTNSSGQSQRSWFHKIVDEWKMLERDLPGTIYVRVYETRIDLLRAAIMGADGTPYHDGLFFFDVNFPDRYPDKAPSVTYHAHGLRINPNLYSNGKVCLSLLGTWHGLGVENWVAGQSNMLQVLLSIQGLILNAEPYYNEPGFERKGGKVINQCSKDYSENVFLLSLKTMLYTMRNPPKYFEDLVFGHFYTRAHDILAACRAYLEGAEVGSYDKSKSTGPSSSSSSSRFPSPSLSLILSPNSRSRLIPSPNPSEASQLKHPNCSELLKKNLPSYIKSLVEAFTKIGVKDCEKFLVPVEKVVKQPTQQDGSSSRRKSKLLAQSVPTYFG